jgi:hypothetical protein
VKREKHRQRWLETAGNQCDGGFGWKRPIMGFLKFFQISFSTQFQLQLEVQDKNSEFWGSKSMNEVYSTTTNHVDKRMNLPEEYRVFLEEQGVEVEEVYAGYHHQGRARGAFAGDLETPEMEMEETASKRSNAVPQRYFTILPAYRSEGTIERLQKDICQSQDDHDQLERHDVLNNIKHVPFCRDFFMLAGTTRISQCTAFREGKMLCMDLSSALAVYALQVEQDDHVLDICCAPGIFRFQDLLIVHPM